MIQEIINKIAIPIFDMLSKIIFSLLTEIFIKTGVWQLINNNGNGIIAICTTLYLVVTWRMLRANRRLYAAKFMPVICINYDSNAQQFKITNIYKYSKNLQQHNTPGIAVSNGKGTALYSA